MAAVETKQDAMSELQATIELAVELNKFYNVDLFQRGFYQIRTSLKTPPKWPAKVEVSLNKPAKPEHYRGSQAVLATIVNNVTISRSFQILYRNEDTAINDAILYRIHTLVDSSRLEESLEGLDLQLQLELWFGEEEDTSNSGEKMELCSTRTLQLHFSPTKGLHCHLPVLFDYFHLCALEVTLHATLIAIHQPYLNMPRPQKSSWAGQPDQNTLESVYYGQRPLSGLPGGQSNSRMQHAHVMHKRICTLLLSAHESLQQTLASYLTKLPGSKLKLEHKDCHTRLSDIILNLQGMTDEDDLIQQAITDITQLCAENVILWAQFLEEVTLRTEVHKILAKDHHNERVRRFAEAFFTLENPKASCLSCYDPGTHGHNALAGIVRSSAYFQQMRPLSVECTELDGDATTLPIIFEDIYHDSWSHLDISMKDSKAEGSENSNNSHKTLAAAASSSSLNGEVTPRQKSRSKKNFIKNIKPEAFKRPSSYSCSDAEKMEIQKAIKNVDLKDDKLGVQLIGYRKVPKPETEASRAVLLGTLSPSQEQPQSAAYPLRPASSNMSILPRTCWSRGSISSLPEFTNMGEGETPTAGVESPQQVQAAETGAEGRGEGEGRADSRSDSTQNWAQRRAVFKAHRSHTAPVVDATSPSEFGLTEEGEEYGNVGSDSVIVGADRLAASQENGSPDLASARDDVDDDTYVMNGYDETLIAEGRSVSDDSGVRLSSANTNLSSWDTMEALPTVSDSSLPSDVRLDDIAIDSRDASLGGLAEESLRDSSANPPTEASDLSRTPSTRSDHKITVIELLREEYERTQREKSASGPPSAEVSPVHCQRASSDTDILRNLENAQLAQQKASEKLFKRTTTASGAPKERVRLSSSSSYPELSRWAEHDRPKLVSAVGHSTVNFVNLRESMKLSLNYPGHLYSESARLASTSPYLLTPDHFDDGDGLHLIICVHGLDGNSADLRLVRTYIEMALPGYRLEFLMSERNQQDTFADFEKMTDKLVSEILFNMEIYSSQVSRISFVGHSLGNIIIRSALTSPKLAHLLPKMYTFLSLSGPHLGALYNNSGLVNMGMWFMQKWKKSGSLLQLSLKDTSDPRQSFLYRLSQKPVLQNFKHVLLVGSCQDRYVPYHSSRIEMCRAAQKDSSVFGKVYQEMVENILTPIIRTPTCKLIRYDVFHALPSTANTIIGRAAHIAVLDSEVFIEKFLLVTGLKYFK